MATQLLLRALADPEVIGQSSEGESMPPDKPDIDEDRAPDNVTIQDVWSALQRLAWLVDGNQRYNIKGIRGELEDTKKTVAILAKQREQTKWVLAGLSVGMTITTGATLVNVLPGILTAISSIK